jgi:TolA-binding protein
LKNNPDAVRAAKVLGEAVAALRKEAAAQPDNPVKRRKVAEGLYWRADALVAAGGASVEAAEVFSEVHKSFADVSPELGEKALYQEARTFYLSEEYARGLTACAAYRERYSGKAAFHAECLLLSARCAFHAPLGSIPESLRREGPRFYREAGGALKDPTEARWARYMSGVALYFLGEYPDAVEGLEAVLRELTEGAPSDAAQFAELTFYLADSLSQQPRPAVASPVDQERWKRASALYAEYLQAAAQSGAGATHVHNALVNLGLCQEWLEEHDKAASTFESFLEKFPEHELVGQVRFELGNAQLVIGDLEKAVLAYASAAEIKGNSVLAARALYQKAMLERRLERPAEAVETLAGFFRKHSESAEVPAQLTQDAHFQQGVALLEAGKAVEGRVRLVEYLERMPGTSHETEVRNQLGRSLLDDGRPQEAIEVLGPLRAGGATVPGRDQAIYLVAWCYSGLAVAEDGAGAASQDTRHREEMESAYRQLIAEHPESPLVVDAMLELGQHLFNRKAYAESKKWLGKAREILEREGQPEDEGRLRTILERSWFGLAFIAYEEKEFAASAKLLDRVLENPGSPLAPRAAFQAGRALSQLGKHEAAAARFSRVTDEYKNRGSEQYEESLLRLGENYHQLGQYELAIQCQDRLLAEYPEGDLRHEAQFARGFALQFSDDHDSAVKAYRKVVAGTRLPVAARAQYHIGECRIEQRRHRDAAREFNTTVANFDFGGDYEEWVRRSLLAAGTAFQEVEDHEAAAAQFEELIERFPQSKEGRAARDRLAGLGK